MLPAVMVLYTQLDALFDTAAAVVVFTVNV